MKIVHASCTRLLYSQLTSLCMYRFLVEPPIFHCCIYACNTMVHYSQHLSTSSMNSVSGPTFSPSQRSWCDPPRNAFWRVWFKALCMTAISKSSVEHWKELSQNAEHDKFEKHKKVVLNRFENMNITAGLVLTTSAVFISTNPPIQSLVPYGNDVSYILEVFSFVAALISLIAGTSVVIIYEPCYAHKDILESFEKSRFRLICCLILMASPSLALVLSILGLMTAVFIAGFTSDKLFVKVLTGVIILIIILLAALAVYVFLAPLKKAIKGTDNTTDKKGKATRSTCYRLC
ncbi:uncharacterized protein EDB93DRAFT_911385 [Suillus bovinus]|uniref:uncharacterized protein n=1 Tax=Suillus bovinus TaxID=48563 RepID=UPI001B87DDA5|nr:uncharacterized protein EDB93DRAFT_911385 [Suillus bovinus]KAG2132321.1 hypothetical protein EDB93DRAFT_911385 [Suillus bovinus]